MFLGAVDSNNNSMGAMMARNLLIWLTYVEPEAQVPLA